MPDTVVVYGGVPLQTTVNQRLQTLEPAVLP